VWGDTSPGSVSAGAADQVYFQTNGDFVIEGGVLRPSSDGVRDLGTGSNKWQDVYASNGTIRTSDARLKENVAEVSDGLETVGAMRPVSYEWKENGDSDTRLGFIAQEIEEIVPEAVNRPDDEDGYLGMNYEMLIPVVVSALQEQQCITSDLEADLDAKDARIEDQRERIERLESRVENKDVALDGLRDALDDKDERIDATASQQGAADD